MFVCEEDAMCVRVSVYDACACECICVCEPVSL